MNSRTVDGDFPMCLLGLFQNDFYVLAILAAATSYSNPFSQLSSYANTDAVIYL